MVKDIATVLRFLWWLVGAPPVGAHESHLFRWRLSVTVLLMANLTATAFFVVAAAGATPWFFSGFASNTQVQSVLARSNAGDAAQQEQFRQIQMAQLDAQILAARTRQCSATKNRDGHVPGAEDALHFTTNRLQEKLDSYWKIAGHQYRLPDCSEV